jgi:two-component system, OmpR family, response regulator CpxR
VRPKKVILLVDEDENRRSIFKFTLAIHGYRVIEADDAKAAAVFVRISDPNGAGSIALVIAWDQPGDTIIRKLKAMSNGCYIPMLLLCDADGGGSFCDAHLPVKTSPIELLERIRIMAARKRGPRKGSLHPDAAEPLAPRGAMVPMPAPETCNLNPGAAHAAVAS